jgi:hypothetical protein
MRMKRLICSLLSASFVYSLSSSADVVNVAENATPANSSPLWSGAKWDIHMLIDGDTSTVFHLDTTPDTGANYTLDLGKDYDIREIRIYPRQDGCCPARLANIHVSVNKDSGGSIGSEVWGTDLFTDGSDAGANAGGVVKVTLPAPATGRWVEVKALADPVPDYSLQVTELEVYADVPASEVNRALGGLVTANQPVYSGQTVTSLVNGNRADVVHGAAELSPGFAYDINLGTTINLSRIVLWPRQDTCCAERLTNFRVSVHSDDSGKPGPSVWSADLYNDGSNPPSDPGTREVLLASADASGTFKGQWIRIETLENPVQDFALQLAEVEAFGEVVGSANLFLTGQPKDAAVGLGQTVSFTVFASAPGGDPTKIAYQWQKNGIDIPGGTNATYTTPFLGGADDKSKFRAVVSYPGLPPQTSSEATLRIDLAYHAKVSTSSPLWGPGGWNIGMLVDGNRNAVFHLDTTPALNAAYDVNLGDPVKIEEIDIYPRQDGCCPERFSNLQVSVHKDNSGSIGDPVWSATIFTDGSNPGSSGGTIVRLAATNDPTGNFEGQWIRIESLDDPVPDYALQMTELEVYGSFASSTTTLTITQDPSDVATGLGATTQLSVSTKIVNGDPTKVTYQWQRNGTNIPGATGAIYTTPPLTSADDKAKYQVVVSYPGLADQTSAVATLRINYAFHAKAYTSSPLWVPGGWTINNLVDGDRRGVFHLDTAPATGAAYQVNLGMPVQLDEIELWARQDGCCGERLTNFRVTVNNDKNGAIGDPVWTADFFTDGTNPLSAPGSVVHITADKNPGGKFAGQWIQVQSLEDPVQDYALQMTELEAYGQPVSTAGGTPNIGIASAGNKLRLSWSSGSLESATDVTGPYQPVLNAASPWDVAPNQTRQFYRAR